MTALAAVARQGGDPKGLRAQHDRAAANAATPNLSSDKPHKSCGQGAAINLSDSGPQQEQSMTDVEAIVGKLSDVQREIVMNQSIRIGGMNPPRRYIELCEYGLADCTVNGDEDGERWTFHLTPLGLAGRTYLLKDETR